MFHPIRTITSKLNILLSMLKCLYGDSDYNFEEMEKCLSNEPTFETDCTEYNYNTTGIGSFNDQNFKGIKKNKDQ